MTRPITAERRKMKFIPNGAARWSKYENEYEIAVPTYPHGGDIARTYPRTFSDVGDESYSLTGTPEWMADIRNAVKIPCRW